MNLSSFELQAEEIYTHIAGGRMTYTEFKILGKYLEKNSNDAAMYLKYLMLVHVLDDKKPSFRHHITFSSI
jgi:hypothetical protein